MKFKKYGGSGEAIIFLLGANNEPYWYESFFKRLGKTTTVYAISYPGINNDDKIPKHRLVNYLEYINTVITKDIGVEKYYLAGSSLGSYLAVKYCNLSGITNVKGLILLSPMFKLQSYNILSIAIRFLLNELQRLIHRNRKEITSNLSPVIFKSIPTRIKHSKFVLRLLPITRKEIPNIKYLAVVGEKDKMIDIQYVLSVLSPKQTTIYRDLGHDGFVLDSRRTINLINDFIK